MTLKRLCFISLFLLASSGQAYSADTQWAVVIGISEYKNLPEDQWLKFAHEDARSFADHLKSRLVGVPPENVKFLLNQEATSENIKDALGSWLPDRAGPGDTVFIYFAGHGIVDKTDEAYFVTYDTNPDRLYATAYPMLEMKRILASLPHRHLVLISDACKSGSIGKEARTSRDLEVVKINDFFKGIVGGNADVSKSDFVLTAASSNEKSYESEEWGGGHGAFTFHLIEGLKGAADRDTSGIVDANEIYDYVRDNVRKATGDKQHPVAATSNFDGSLALSVLKDSAAPLTTNVAAERPSIVTSAGPSPGTILVTTNVANTRILIDSEFKGAVDPSTPKSFSLAPGQHIFEATRDGYTRQQKIVDVQPGRQIVQTVALEPATPSLAPDLRLQLANSIKLIGTRDNEAIKGLQTIFVQLTTARISRGLLADEEDLTNEVFLTLGDLYSRRKQPAPLKAITEDYLQIFPIVPEEVAAKAPAEIRASLESTGATLTIAVEPIQSAMEIDSLSYGSLTGPKTLLMRSGPHKLKVQRVGYIDLEMNLDLAAGQSQTVKDRLKLAKINVMVLSQTSGVLIARNGQPAGSFMPLSQVRNTLRADQVERLNAELQRRGLDNQTQVALLRDIEPDTADLRLRFTRDKYSSQDARIELAANADQIYKLAGEYVWDGVVKLDQLIGTLDVSSVPTGADVLVNNKSVGKTPLSQWRAEIGDYDVVVKVGVWKSVHKVTIRDKETTKVDARLRPPLVFLGTHSPVVEAAKLRDVENRIAQVVPKAFANYLGEYQNYTRYEFTRDFLLGVTGAAPVRGNPAQRLAEMKDRFGTELFLFGYFPSELDFLSNKIRFYLFSSFTTRPDFREVQLDRPESVETFFKELDSVILRETDLFKPYIGLSALDTELAGREVVVLKVDEGGPAARAEIQKGDAILSINGEPPEALKLSQWVSRNPAGSELKLEVGTASGRKTISFKSDPLPRFVIESGAKGYVNSILAQLEWLKLQTSPQATYESNIILLNQALAYISAEDWSNALTVLNRFAADGSKASVLRPAVYYYKGFCFERLNDRASARQWYEMAAKEKDTLLQSELAFDFQTLGSWRIDYLK